MFLMLYLLSLLLFLYWLFLLLLYFFIVVVVIIILVDLRNGYLLYTALLLSLFLWMLHLSHPHILQAKCALAGARTLSVQAETEAKPDRSGHVNREMPPCLRTAALRSAAAAILVTRSNLINKVTTRPLSPRLPRLTRSLPRKNRRSQSRR